jgi:triosephosphate isomerase
MDSKNQLVKTRVPFVGGNWKAVGFRNSIKSLVEEFNTSETLSQLLDVVIAPGFLHLGDVASNLKRTFDVAAQDCSKFGVGAYTGDTSATQLRDFGLNWVILGHSERRKYHNDTDEVVSLKITRALNAGLRVIACFGETKQERDAGRTEEVVLRQVEAICRTTDESGQGWWSLVLAYEPVWAIGTGETASPAQAQAIHLVIRRFIAEKFGPKKASKVRIIYGGSVKPGNANALYQQPDIDGFLVGGASLIARDFLSICRAVQTQFVDIRKGELLQSRL